jgi:hypothetical protein
MVEATAVSTIHGFDVKAQFTTPGGGGIRPGRFILVDRGEKYKERWVSSWLADGDAEWSQGHYFETFLEARDHFLERCEKEVRYE